ncbi:hypothetical protein Ancab_023405 [Ancistrocladus abbreviatus]
MRQESQRERVRKRSCGCLGESLGWMWGMSELYNKRRKVSDEDHGKPTGYLTKGSLLDHSKSKEDPDRGKFILKSSTVRVSVVRKTIPTSESNKDQTAAKEDSKQEQQHESSTNSNGLQSLCQNYHSDEDD